MKPALLALTIAAVACGGTERPAVAETPAPAEQGVVSPLPAWGPALQPLADASLERELLAAELDRDPNAPALASALASDDPHVVTRAAWSLARIGGPVAIERFTAWLHDGRDRPAAALAAIAALPSPPAVVTLADRDGDLAELEERVWHRYAVTQDPAAAAALLLAIARVGTATSRDRLAADLAIAPPPHEIERYVAGMHAIAILCRRGFGLQAAGVNAIATGLSGEPSVRRAAALALERCAGPSAEQLAGAARLPIVERLAAHVGSAADDDDAHAAWAALAALGELPSTIPDDVLGTEPRAWRVEVAAVHALAAHADGRRTLATRLASLDLASVHGPRWHAVLEAVRGLRPVVESTPELLEALAPFDGAIAGAHERASSRDRKALVLARCEVAVLRAIAGGDAGPVERCGEAETGISPTHGARLAIDAIARTGAMTSEAKAGALLARVGDARRDVAEAALAALAEIDDPRVGPALRDALSGDDVGIVSAAAAAIGTRAIDRQRRDPAAVPALVSAVHRLDNDRAVEARVAAIDALGNLARSAAAPVLPGAGAADSALERSAPEWLERDVLPLASDPNAAVREAAGRALSEHAELAARFQAAVPTAFPQGFAPPVHAALDARHGVRAMQVATSAGSFTIDFTGAPAPIAQASLVSLARNGFFDGLQFHRVVPDFVIQGGDPRGDGYGGPGYVMPCEWSNLRFERAVVGIALAGKDTGGSQIFVAHGRPVHLDARFSVIGRVTEGMEVVDAILPYDTIDRVVLVEDDPS